MRINGVIIQDVYAEAFSMWAVRLIVTAVDRRWVEIGVQHATGYGTSIIGCDAEAGLERTLDQDKSPDGRPAAAILIFARSLDALTVAVRQRVGQCLLTCPTVAVYDGQPAGGEGHETIELGRHLSYFGDGYQFRTMVNGRTCWQIPVMDGAFTVEHTVTAVPAIGGGNFLVCGSQPADTLKAAMRSVEAIQPLAGVITPFPGGVCRSGSKVGSRYKNLIASTNQAYCPTLRDSGESKLPEGVNCVYEIVIDALTRPAVGGAMRAGIRAACQGHGDGAAGIQSISAGSYGGQLGKIHLRLHDVMET